MLMWMRMWMWLWLWSECLKKMISVRTMTSPNVSTKRPLAEQEVFTSQAITETAISQSDVKCLCVFVLVRVCEFLFYWLKHNRCSIIHSTPRVSIITERSETGEWMSARVRLLADGRRPMALKRALNGKLANTSDISERVYALFVKMEAQSRASCITLS